MAHPKLLESEIILHNGLVARKQTYGAGGSRPPQPQIPLSASERQAQG